MERESCSAMPATERFMLLRHKSDYLRLKNNISSTLGESESIVDFTPINDNNTETRICISPESGIDCDEMNSPEQMKTVAMKHAEITKCQDDATLQLINTERVHFDSNIKNVYENEYLDRIGVTQKIFTDGENLIKSKDSLQICRNSSGKDNDALQIVSVHSLEERTNSFSTLDLKTSVKCRREVHEAECESLCPILTDPLPKCSHLYLRKIKGFNTGIKSVLVVEAEYSQAAPLPAHILKKQMKNGSCTSFNRNSRYSSVKSSNRKLKTEISRRLSNKLSLWQKSGNWVDSNSRNSCVIMNASTCRQREYDWESYLQRKQVHPINTVVNNSTKPLINAINKNTCFSIPANIDRINQLRERLKQKEADLEKIRKNVVLWKKIV